MTATRRSRPPQGPASTTATVDASQSNNVDLLAVEAFAIRELGATVIDATDIGTYAVEYAHQGWPVFPARGKIPAIPNPHPEGIGERRECKGECGLDGHGVYDATTDIAKVTAWWGGRYRGCNIGARIPDGMLLIDVDPRHGGDKTWAALERKYGPFPDGMMQFSGRGDGGGHRFVRRPPGHLDPKRLGPGIDFKTSSGYAVMAPSLHPDTRKPYRRVDGPIPTPPDWFVALATVPPPQLEPPQRKRRTAFAEEYFGSPAEQYARSTSWAQILTPHGWECLDADCDADGARWLHPTHTSACSATVRHGCLFVYSTSTVFDVTEAGTPKGYTKFRAHAVLNHASDMRAAARAVIGNGVV